MAIMSNGHVTQSRLYVLLLQSLVPTMLAKNTFKILRGEHHKIFKVRLAIFQHRKIVLNLGTVIRTGITSKKNSFIKVY